MKGYPRKELQETQEQDCDSYWDKANAVIQKESSVIKDIDKDFKEAVMITVREKGHKDRTCFKKQLYDDKGYCETTKSHPGDVRWGICSPACKWVGNKAKVI